MNRADIVLVTLCAIAVFVFACRPISQADTFYHLKTGEVILATGTIPDADIFSYTAAGNRWVTHEWLAQVLFALVAGTAGLGGLIALAALAASGVYAFLVLRAIRLGASPPLAALCVMLLMIPGVALFVVRPQIVSFILFPMLLMLLERLRSSARFRDAVFVAATIALWANMHAGVILGVVLVAGYAIAPAIKSFAPCKSRRMMAWTAIAAAFASALNPNGWEVLRYPFIITHAATAFSVSEWQPITMYLQVPHIAAYLLVSVLAIILLVRMLGFGRDRDLLLLAIFAGLWLAPLVSVRHLQLFLVACAPWVALSAHKAFMTRVRPRIWMSSALTLALVVAIAGFARFPRAPLAAHAFPVEAAGYIEQSDISGNVFNLYNEGSYLLWRWSPDRRVFIDGRSEVYPPQVIDEFFEITGGGPRWRELVYEKYDIRAFLLAYRPESLLRSIAPLLENLKADGWRLEFQDDVYLVLTRP